MLISEKQLCQTKRSYHKVAVGGQNVVDYRAHTGSEWTIFGKNHNSVNFNDKRMGFFANNHELLILNYQALILEFFYAPRRSSAHKHTHK